MIYNNRKATFNELLDEDKTVSVQTKNLQILVTKIFKLKIRELSSIMHVVFQKDDSKNYKVSKSRGFKPGNPKSAYYETKTISFLRPKL